MQKKNCIYKYVYVCVYFGIRKRKRQTESKLKLCVQAQYKDHLVVQVKLDHLAINYGISYNSQKYLNAYNYFKI